jgi:hypothetical protein
MIVSFLLLWQTTEKRKKDLFCVMIPGDSVHGHLFHHFGTEEKLNIIADSRWVEQICFVYGGMKRGRERGKGRPNIFPRVCPKYHFFQLSPISSFSTTSLLGLP